MSIISTGTGLNIGLAISGQDEIGTIDSGKLSNVADDPTPQLGADLDVNGRSLVTTSNGNIILAPDGTGQTQITGGTTNAAPLNIQYSNDGALVGPQLNLTRISASPVENDVIGGIEFRGRDDAGNTDTYAGIRGMIGKPNSGAERGLILFQAMNDGSNETVMTMSRKGLFMNASNDIYFDGPTDDDVRIQLSVEDPTSNRLIRLPDLSGTLLIDESDSGLLKLQKADDGATAGPSIRLERTSASPAQSDILGILEFQGQDDAGNVDTYSSITGQIERTTSGGERGRLRFNCMADGSAETIATMNRNGLFFGPNNKIGFAGTTDNNNFITLLAATDPTGFRTIGLPDSDGTVMLNLSEDTSPQLGSDLDVNGNKIVSASNGDIEIEPNGSGAVILDGQVNIEGARPGNSLFIDTDMSSDTTDDLHNAMECQLDYTGTSIGSGTRQQSISFSFKDDDGTRQAGRFNSEYTRTDPSANKMKLIAIDHGTAGNGQIDVSPVQASVNKPFKLQSYAVASLPTTGIGAGAMAYATDETGGAVPVFYDGSNWRRVTDRAVAS
jgi:hypothetical protein